mmetsp:Transcript_11551/g.31844  ORF Transcript_11551/g.31844 Transcript_11551/m.31844 type:complete len:135 (+) Transcript_11551:3-407(+)
MVLARPLLAALLRVAPAVSPAAFARVTPAWGPALQRINRQTRMMCSSGTEGQRSVVEQCRQKISDALDPVQIQVDGAYDDPNGSHITIFCVSEAFEGKRSLARQQMVFKAIWDEMQGPVHAVDQMVLKAPSEVE